MFLVIVFVYVIHITYIHTTNVGHLHCRYIYFFIICKCTFHYYHQNSHLCYIYLLCFIWAIPVLNKWTTFIYLSSFFKKIKRNVKYYHLFIFLFFILTKLINVRTVIINVFYFFKVRLDIFQIFYCILVCTTYYFVMKFTEIFKNTSSIDLVGTYISVRF